MSKVVKKEVEVKVKDPTLGDVLLNGWLGRKQRIVAAFKKLREQDVEGASTLVQDIIDELHAIEAQNILNFHQFEPVWRHCCTFTEKVAAGKETRFLTSHLALVESMIDESIGRLEDSL